MFAAGQAGSSSGARDAVILGDIVYISIRDRYAISLASRSHAFTRGENRRPGQLPIRELCSFARNRATQSDCRSGKRHVRAHSSAYALPVGYIHVYISTHAGRNRSTVVIIMSLRVYQGCCYVSGYYYAKDRATRSHQTVRARQRCVCIVAYGIWKECLLFSPPVRV